MPIHLGQVPAFHDYYKVQSEIDMTVKVITKVNIYHHLIRHLLVKTIKEEKEDSNKSHEVVQ